MYICRYHQFSSCIKLRLRLATTNTNTISIDRCQTVSVLALILFFDGPGKCSVSVGYIYDIRFDRLEMICYWVQSKTIIAVFATDGDISPGQVLSTCQLAVGRRDMYELDLFSGLFAPQNVVELGNGLFLFHINVTTSALIVVGTAGVHGFRVAVGKSSKFLIHFVFAKRRILIFLFFFLTKCIYKMQFNVGERW